MNNEETILDPQTVAGSSANKPNAETGTSTANKVENATTNDSKSKAKKDNDVAGKVGAAAIGAAAGIGGTMYADDIKAAVMPEQENLEEPIEEQPEEQDSTPESTPDPQPKEPSKTPQDQPEEPEVKVVDVKYVDVDGDGRADTVVKLDNGIHLVDTDGDGEADIAMADLNGNKQLDDGEYAYVSDEHIAMPTGGAIPAGGSTSGPSVELVDVVQVDLDHDGNPETAALLNVNGERMAIIDVDNDGMADVAVMDENGNGRIDDGEVIDITAKPVAMPNAAGGSMYASNPQAVEDNEVEVHVINVGQADLNQDGIVENVALVEIEGDEVLLVDIDREGTADAMIADVDGDGQNEIVDISDENIAMPSMSDGDMYLAQADSEPDYMNDADVDMYDA